MKNTDIESLLRDSRPQVQDNPAFLLEVQQKMRAVEGIKKEVDRQRRSGRSAQAMALACGLILGGATVYLACLYPVEITAISEGILSSARRFFESYKQYLMLPIAGCGIALGIILGRQKYSEKA